jgi:hypothetical protein
MMERDNFLPFWISIRRKLHPIPQILGFPAISKFVQGVAVSGSVVSCKDFPFCPGDLLANLGNRWTGIDETLK